ncbi:hypothetical protein EXU85_20275 [Spirosoma sp. KCTC 42546]|uniref:HNH endonuclease n=1 Tax=Spirosoma sp. KCTC 42546 TaxID=2520506 RepID=UPI001158D91F|nr:hypothetical protein [Spirosoma sp. KCTC 42546]QDK80816.1 hypothetical protein EXU85_20275 [Spirosoma sp. KCTC 42546]
MSVTGLVKLIRKLPQYEAWKRSVFLRDHFQCQQCGKRNGRKRVIEAHHLMELSTLVRMNGLGTVEDAISCLALWCPDNGHTLCHSCHEQTESYPKSFRKLKKEKKRKNG